MPNNLTDLLTAIQKAKELFPDITKDGDLQQVVKTQIIAECQLPVVPQLASSGFALLPAEVATTRSLDSYSKFVFAEDHFKLRYGHAPAQPGNFYKAIKNMFIQEFKQEPSQHKKAVSAFRSADTFHYPLDWLDAAFDTLQVATPAYWKLS
jgi:hypothetical protein